MKRKLLLLITLIVSYSYAQTECPLDQSVFSGTVTISGIGASETKASDAANSHRFGERVAIDGSIAAVVSRSNGAAAGKVYIFINDGSGNWTQQTILTASDGFAGDNFGSAVAIEGNYLVVGARSQLDADGIDTGAAYLFEYDGSSTWTEVAIFEPSDGATEDRFGESVSIEGDFILVGARNGCTGGCAYVYENDGTNTFTYTETKLEPQVQSNYDGARFGHDVLVKDGRAYVGGPYDYSSVGRASAGSVQIWDQANDGSWSRTHRLRGTETSESFGWAVDVEGDYLAIGAMNFEVSTTAEADQGRVYVYKADSNGDYLEANRIMIQNDDKDSYNDQRFGTDVVLEDGFLYVGTFGNGSANTDAVYIFKDDGTNNWTQISKITSGAGWDEFSNRAVAVSFPTLLIGQNEADSPSNSGSAYFIKLNNDVQPVASVTETVGTHPTINDGMLKVNFDDEATETEIHFSIDGGTTYPYTFDDDLGSAEITNLGVGTYDVWVQFDTSCPISIGSFEINIAYTSIPDTNFEAALDALGYDDITSDGQVPTGLISGVTSLDVSSQNISDLTGINDFVALEVLRLQYNNLTSLDVSNLINLRTLWAANGNVFSSIDVSNNTALEDFRIRQYSDTSIDLSNNTALTRFACESCDLTSLDTSNNVNLTFLDLWNSDIASLDLSANTNLETLDVYSTNLVTLDLSSNTVLETLIANDISTLTSLNVQNGNNTNITSFNTTSNPSLSCIVVDDTTYSITNWTNVDIGITFSTGDCRYTAIPDTNFEASLEALGYDDISADGQVPTTLIEVVTTLDISNESITDLTGIEGFTALVSLNCEDNSLSSLDVSQNTNLQTLIFDNNNVSSLTLGANTNLDSIEGRYNQLAAIDLSQNTNLTFINLRDNLFTTVDVSQNTLLETINLRGCVNLTSLDLTNNSSLEQLYLQDCILTTLDVSQNTLLEVIALERNNLSTLDISNNTLLQQLRVPDNSLTKLDTSNNSALTRISCQNNNLTFLNAKNGNNTGIATADFDVTGNSSLTCILVDDATWSSTNWTNVDGGATFFDTGYCRYTTIPDANFEAALEALGYDDISTDGQVPTALIEVVTSLDVKSNSIADLTGIEDFEVLTTLNCRNNSLTALDLTNNIALESLTANENSIESIDVSQNTNLNFIDIGANSLTSLDVSNNTALTRLECPVNDITSLDISNNVNLWYLEAFQTDITAIDLSNNVSLEKVILYKTNITTIDVSNNIQLTELRVDNTDLTTIDLTNNTLLESLRVNGSDITSVDLTKQTVLEEFYGQTGILEFINIKNGNNTIITAFDVRNNSNLECILVDDATYSTTNWTDINGTTSFSDTYCRYTAIPDAVFEARLETLGYDDINGDGQVPTALIEDVTYLFVPSTSLSDLTGIEDFLALETITCSGGNLTSVDLSTNTQLRDINFSNNNISTIDISNSPALEELNLRGNNLSAIDLTNNVALLELDLSGSDITNIDLSKNTLLTSLDLSDNNMTSLDITNNTNLTSLEITSLNITTIDLSNNTLLEELIASYSTLTSLDLSTNVALTYLECEELSQLTALDLTTLVVLEEIYLNDSDALTYIDIRNGNNSNILDFETSNSPNLSCISVDDVSYATANWTVDMHTSFTTTAYCQYTAIPDANFEAELETLGYDDISTDGQVPTALIEGVTTLSISGSGITDLTGIEDFEALISLNVGNNVLTTLDVSNNLLLESLLAYNTSLSSIDVSVNTALKTLRIHDNAIASIDLSTNTALEYIGIDNNQLTTLDLQTNTLLTFLSCANNDITSLDLSNNTLLEEIEVNDNLLTSLEIGANTSLLILYANGNNLTTLDLSAYTLLEEVYVQNNSLSSLNVQNGNNTGIYDFEVINNPNLSCILVDDEVYSTSNWTDIDNTTSFSDTYCRYTSIPDPNFEAELEALGYDDISADGKVPTALIEVVSNLNVSNKSITDLTGIEDFTTLTNLTVSDNNLGTLDVSNNINLITLDCQFAGLSALDVSANVALKNLYANGNTISSINLTNNTELVQLGMYDNDLSVIDVTSNTKLTTLDLFGNQLASIDLTNNLLLEDLLLEANDLTSLDVSANTVLKNFTCNNNDLSALNMQNGAHTTINSFNATNNADLYCILVDNQTYSASNWTNIDNQTSFNEVSCNLAVLASKVFLQGAMLNPITGEENWMRDDLRANAGVYGPTSPYGDGAMITESVGTDDVGANSMVDWIWVELRDATDPTIVIAGKSAVLQRDGDIVDVADDRVTPLSFDVPSKNYYVVIQHRNHLAIRSANSIALSNTTTSINLSNDTALIDGGTNALVDMGSGIFAMIGGDYDENGQIQNSDVNEVIQKLGNSGYNRADLDMNGQIQNTDINNILNPNLGKGQQF